MNPGAAIGRALGSIATAVLLLDGVIQVLEPVGLQSVLRHAGLLPDRPWSGMATIALGLLMALPPATLPCLVFLTVALAHAGAAAPMGPDMSCVLLTSAAWVGWWLRRHGDRVSA